jgi:hypothetical protein
MFGLAAILVAFFCLIGFGWEVLKFAGAMLGLRGWDHFVAYWIVFLGMWAFFWIILQIFFS